MAVRIDFRRDLTKVRAQLPKVLKALETGSCDYTAPCVIGAMVNPRKRSDLEYTTDDTDVGTLIRAGLLKLPSSQHEDAVALQQAFDSGSQRAFMTALERVERKYLPASGTEARSDATGTGAAEGDGPAPKGGRP